MYTNIHGVLCFWAGLICGQAGLEPNVIGTQAYGCVTVFVFSTGKQLDLLHDNLHSTRLLFRFHFQDNVRPITGDQVALSVCRPVGRAH